MVGIVGYGVYVPRYRIKTEDIAAVWGEDGPKLAKGLGVFEMYQDQMKMWLRYPWKPHGTLLNKEELTPLTLEQST